MTQQNKRPSFQFYPLDWLTPNTYGNNYADLPRSGGVYLLVATTIFPDIKHKILYVGMSKNIRGRLKNHDVLKECEAAFDYVQIYFKEFRKSLREKERYFIKLFNPSYNLQHRIKGI